jgi:hypothetical protein
MCQCRDATCPCKAACRNMDTRVVMAFSENWYCCTRCRRHRGLGDSGVKVPRKRKSAKKVRRVVLGVGHPWFSCNNVEGEFLHVGLLDRAYRAEQPLLIHDLGSYNRIRLVAEVLK